MILSPGCRPGARFTGFQGGDNSLGLAWQHGDKVATSWRQNEVTPFENSRSIGDQGGDSWRQTNAIMLSPSESFALATSPPLGLLVATLRQALDLVNFDNLHAVTIGVNAQSGDNEVLSQWPQ